jgi:hypothetical protein
MTTGIDVKATIKETREAKRTKPIVGILGNAKHEQVFPTKILAMNSD